MKFTKRQEYIQREQRKIADIVTEKFKDYYLTGGTALAFYFSHRFSEDLDFFTQKYKEVYPDKIMSHVSGRTSFKFILESEQNKVGLVPMKIYFMELKKSSVLKIDFVQDFSENLKPTNNGVHSIEDIYYRKIIAALGLRGKETDTGRLIPTGRQSAKDLIDLYFLSQKFMPVSDFFLEYFSYDKVELLINWYRSYERMELKLELLRLIPHVNTDIILKYLDREILKALPKKIE